MNNSVILNKNLVLLARVLERLEHSTEAVDAEQYRSVVNHLASELAVAPQDAGLQAVLQACPAAAELYENINYQHAGLCRSSLDLAVAAEAGAREAIDKARQR
ncbi:MAG: hypothetical protein JWQ13_3644 [Ramlibacter sp.]|jgi:hypothetical protein|nr:hypothetical protein [Ramlibacter sp.]